MLASRRGRTALLERTRQAFPKSHITTTTKKKSRYMV
jgi:hypothetical protein